MDVLKPGSINDGSFVRTLVGETGTGFQEGWHVHKDWFAKTMTYEQAQENLESERGKRVDVFAHRREIEAVVDGKDCKILVCGKAYNPTEHAMGQIGKNLKIGTQFLKEMREPITKYQTTKGVREDIVAHNRDERDAEILADVLNNGFRRVDPAKEFRVRTYDDGTMRAFLTDSYAEIDNRQYLDILSSIIPEGRVSHFRGDADEIFCNILVPDTIMKFDDDDSDYGGMIAASNSEIGTGTANQAPSVFRSICLNGNIWGQTEGTKAKWVHRGGIDYVKLAHAMHENINKQIPLLVPYITAMQEAKRLLFDKSRFVQIVGAIAKDNGIKREHALEIVKQFNQHESDNRNAFGVAAAITRAGQFFGARTCHKFDQIGGDVMVAKNWQKYVLKGATMDDADLAQIFGLGLAV